MDLIKVNRVRCFLGKLLKLIDKNFRVLLLGKISGQMPENAINSVREKCVDPFLVQSRLSLELVHNLEIFEFTGEATSVEPWMRFRFCIKERYLISLINVTVFPRSGAVVLKDGRVLIESMGSLFTAMTFSGFSSEIANLRFVKAKRINSCISCATGPFYHWLLESIPGIIRCKSVYPELKVLLPVKRPAFVDGSLRVLFGEDWKRHIIESETQVIADSVLFYSKLSGGEFLHPSDVALVRDSFLSAIIREPQTRPRRVFISRQKAKARFINESALHDFFVKCGFAVVVLEDLSFIDQVRLFVCAECIAGYHGAGFSHSIFAPSNCRILELFRHDYFNDCYARLAATLSLNYTALVLKVDEDFSLFKNQLESWVEGL